MTKRIHTRTWVLLASLGTLSLLQADVRSDPPRRREETRYDSGELHETFWLEADGARGGRYNAYHRNGRKKAEGTYRHGQLTGTFKEYTESGSMLRRSEYRDGELMLFVRLNDRGTPSHGVAFARDGPMLLDPASGRWERICTRTRDEIRKSLGSIDPGGEKPADLRALGIETKYSIPYRLRPPHQAGELTEKYLDLGLRRIKAYRYLCGLSYEEVEVDPKLNETAQHAAVLSAVRGTFSHNPPRPPDMDEDFYKKAHRGAAGSNLCTPLRTVRRAVDLYMNDSGPRNLPHLGHRGSIIQPRLRRIGIGEAAGWNALTCRAGGRSKGPDLICFPARGWHPVEYLGRTWAWSVAWPNANLYAADKDDLRAELWRLDEKLRLVEPVELSHNAPRSRRWGMGPGVIFRPVFAKGSDLAGESFLVVLRGVEWRSGSPPTRYIVRFFRLTDSAER